MKKITAPLERDEQKSLKDYCNHKNILLVHVPNEGKRSFIANVQLKLQGLEKGFPDNILILPVTNKIIFIELKRNKKYTKSEMETHTWAAQTHWIELLNKRGYAAKMCFGWVHASHFIEEQRQI